ncbi:MAG: bifunctional adenosylcobinamide kinase/adenosylcobinamide-phosphate guanylyltransferase [Candidatus Omnitrophica bacterium]|nr:bifunctional adenosylcobinamide kinase/adenosylcobinamide-phosphate guanylyltransferase [Candidatus Omnitrophota bacterium]
MSKLIFVLGGARSGKSKYASEIAIKRGKKAVFIATAAALDDEMRKRIRLHRISRPKDWGLIEEPMNLKEAVLGLKSAYGTAIIDCLGLWVSNMLMAGMKDALIEKRSKELAAAMAKSKAGLIIVVSNEVGEGIVPGDALSRRFRDLLGLTNQVMASKADEVIMMHAGIPVKIKYGKADV